VIWKWVYLKWRVQKCWFTLALQLSNAPSLLCEQEIGPVPVQLADAFGLVIQCRDVVGEQALLAQTSHTLQQAVQPGKALYPSRWEFSPQEYQEVNMLHCFCTSLYLGVSKMTVNCTWCSAFQLVAHAQSVQAELSSGAEKIIHGYYMASRRVRTQSQGVKMSVTSVKLL